MKRAIIPAVTAIAMAVPYIATAQGDAKATVTAKLAAVVDSSGKARPNPCVVVNAADYGKVQEAACEGGLGYLIVAGDKGPLSLHCAQVASDVDDKGQISAACQLPENKDETKIVDKVLVDTKTDCTPIAREFFGESDTGSSVYFEVTCDNAKGYLVQVWRDPADVKSIGNKPWICDETFRSRGNDCALTKLGVAGARAAEAKRVAALDTYYKGAAPAPAPTAQAAAGPAPAPAAAAAPAGGSAVAMTTPLPDAYTKAVRDNGLTCTPQNPPKQRENTDDHVTIEFRCGNKDDGRLAVFSKKAGVAPAVYDCASVAMIGLTCLDTTEKAGYAAMSTGIRRVSSGSFGGDCAVTQMRLMGSDGKNASFEVKCSDPRIGGEVVSYNAATGKVANVTTCANFAATPGQSIRCSLPGAAR